MRGKIINTFPSFTSVYIKMRNTYEENWVIFGQCKECKNFFQMTEEFRYKGKGWFMWFSSLCKTCDNELRKNRWNNHTTTSKANKKYYKTHKDKIIKSNHIRWKEKWYEKIHDFVRKRIKKLWIRPKECPICGGVWVRIIAHHPDYTKKNLIVFCCDSCHRNIHNWNIKCPKPIEI